MSIRNTGTAAPAAPSGQTPTQSTKESSDRSADRPLRKPGASRGRREVVFDGDPPRPMTELTKAILVRRRQLAAPRSVNLDKRDALAPASPLVLRTDDGAVSYALTHQHRGLQVKRTVCAKASLQVSQVLEFSDCHTFNQWCDTDPFRFEQPLLHQQLRQEGLRLLDGHPSATRPA